MHYLYLDESGDLGFDFVNRKPSKYFTICIVVCPNKQSKSSIEKAVKRTLRNKINYKSKGSRGIKEFNSYIRNHLESEIKPNVPLDIYHKDSKDIYCLQAADLFAWGIRRQYEKRDEEWYTIFKSKVLLDDVYFP